MAARRRGKTFQRLWTQVNGSGVGDFVQRLRPMARPDFLSELHQRGADAILSNSRSAKAAWTHLGTGWLETVDAVATPETLPAVVERRTRLRVNPLAPWATSVVAGLGTVVVVAGNNAAWVEGLGVAGVIGIVGACAATIWRPRVRRRDRRYRVTGTQALTARADVLSGDLIRATSDPHAFGTADRLLVEIQGASRTLEALEIEARRVGLLHEDGHAEHEPRNPAEQDLADELLGMRAELLHDVMHLQALTQHHASRSRSQDRDTYRQVNDDLGTDASGDLS